VNSAPHFCHDGSIELVGVTISWAHRWATLVVMVSVARPFTAHGPGPSSARAEEPRSGVFAPAKSRLGWMKPSVYRLPAYCAMRSLEYLFWYRTLWRGRSPRPIAPETGNSNR